jgi:hypothetical protein
MVYNGNVLSTYGGRLQVLADIFKKGYLNNIRSPDNNTSSGDNFVDISFSITHFFNQWTEFSRGCMHIPYEIKHLEYCFYSENLQRQTHRFIYILNKKGLKKTPQNADLVHTTSREFRVDTSNDTVNAPTRLDFKTCILENIPYINIVGYSHLDKQEESDDEV